MRWLHAFDVTVAGTSSRTVSAATRLNRTTVTAPFAGIVGQRYVSLGDYVNSTRNW